MKIIRRIYRRLVYEILKIVDTHISGIPPELRWLKSYSMSGTGKLKNLYTLGLDVVRRNVPGDFVECGVCNGGSAAAVALALRNTVRSIWLYDSFQGLPEVRVEVDGADAAKYVGRCVGSEEMVKKALQIAGFLEERYIIRKGWFDKTFQEPLPSKVAILHIDADWYDSVLLALNTFYDLVPDGGIIVLDDFGFWEGCREAFYDFVASRQIKPLLERFGHTQAFWCKGKATTR